MIMVNESEVECQFTLKFLLMLLLLFFFVIIIIVFCSCSVCRVQFFFRYIFWFVFFVIITTRITIIRVLCIQCFFFCVLYTVNYGHFLLHFFIFYLLDLCYAVILLCTHYISLSHLYILLLPLSVLQLLLFYFIYLFFFKKVRMKQESFKNYAFYSRQLMSLTYLVW